MSTDNETTAEMPKTIPLELANNRYLVDIGQTKYGSKELLMLLFRDISAQLNSANNDKSYVYTFEIGREESLPVLRIYCNKDNKNIIAIRAFLSFHIITTLFLRKQQYDVTIIMTTYDDYIPHQLYKKFPSIIKKRVNEIKSIPEFKGKIHKIKV
ncbi:MAG: hypothetical protein ACP5NV_02265 [Candidatus Woesearchaeota archaeon]